MITNDDGIKSIGLKVLAESIAPFGDIIVAAPSKQQSAMGRSFWASGNETLQSADFVVAGTLVKAYHCHCSPAWVVQHTLSAACLMRQPDLLVSGINLGVNMGTDVTISGTVGAALQGAISGIPSMAVSVQTNWFLGDEEPSNIPWDTTCHFIRLFTEQLLNDKFEFEYDVINVNIPATATPATPWRLTRQARRPYFSAVLDSPSERSRLFDARIFVRHDSKEVDPESDIYALEFDKQVSVTPLSVDLTA